MSKQPSLWRSLLFVLANVERFVSRAHERGADGIILDLEDSVPSPEKAAARTGLPRSVGQAGAAARPCWCVSITAFAIWHPTWRQP
jgi:citrate lyase subunit beta / citryl-CoA lyase